MNLDLGPWLQFASAVVAAIGLWWGGKRSARVAQRQADQQWGSAQVQTYQADLAALKQESKDQREEIRKLTTEVFAIREEMTRRHREHVAEINRLETILAQYRQYVTRILAWIYQRVETGELATDRKIPAPPEEDT